MLSKTLRTLGLIALVLLPSYAGAEETFFRAYDIDETAYQYGKFGEWTEASPYRIETSGSSTTVTAVSGTPFELLGVGDEIRVELSGVQTRRVVTAKASSISITVNSAINLDVDGGYKFEWRDFAVGTAATDGWIATGLASAMDVHLVVTTLASDSITFSVECRGDGDATDAKQIFTDTYTSATFPDNGAVVVIGEICSSVRVGVKVGTDAGTDAISAHLVTR